MVCRDELPRVTCGSLASVAHPCV